MDKMDIEVKTEKLKKVISCTSRATSSKAIQPILNNILLNCENGLLKVSATDLDLAIECKLNANISTAGKATLPAKKLDEIISRASGDDVNILIDKNFLAKILSDRSKFQINGSSHEEFPDILKNTEDSKFISIDQNELLRAISLTSFAASRFETSSVLSGSCLKIEDGNFEICATDGSRLSRYKGKISNKSKEKKSKYSVVIPSRAMFELERLISNFKDGNELVNISFTPGQVVFQNNDFTLSTRLINGNFPEYENLIPATQPNKIIFSRSEMISSIDRVSILANERTSIIKISIKKDSKTLQLSSSSPDYGNAVDELDVEHKGADIEIAFNYKYLTEALRNLDTEGLNLELDTSLSPLILKVDDNTEYDYTYLIMPVQLR